MKRLACVLPLAAVACSATPGAPAAAMVARPAAPASPDDAGPPAAIADAAGGLVVTSDGIGPLRRFVWDRQDREAAAELIRGRLAPVLPGITVVVDVVNARTGSWQWSVRRGDDELVEVLPGHGEDASPDPSPMMVWTAEIPTADGTKVGDDVGSVIAKHPALVCIDDPSWGDYLALMCQDNAVPGLRYVVDTRSRKLAAGGVVATTITDLRVMALLAIPQ